MSKPIIKNLEKSRVEITSAVPAADFAKYKDRALASLSKKVKIDGFRDGNVPNKVLEAKVGTTAILDEMAQLAIMDAYPTILTEAKIDAIGLPQIQITKIVMDNDLEFTITTAVLPTIKLGDYQKIAKEINKNNVSVDVTDAEIDGATLELRQMRAHQAMHDAGVDHHDHNHANISDDQLPPLDDNFVKTLGKFEGVEDFKTKLKENLLIEKKTKEAEKKRVAMIDAIIDGTVVDLPDMMVDFELDKMLQQFIHDISMMGHTFEDYLKKINKTEVDLKSEWRVNGEKRAKMQMILDEISKEQKIAPSDAEIQSETEKILEIYKDAKDVSEDRVRAYVTQILNNAKVFEYLEGLK